MLEIGQNNIEVTSNNVCRIIDFINKQFKYCFTIQQSTFLVKNLRKLKSFNLKFIHNKIIQNFPLFT